MSTPSARQAPRGHAPVSRLRRADGRAAHRQAVSSRRLRRASLRRRLLQATDALALADLLLGVHLSLGSIGSAGRVRPGAGVGS